MTCSTHTRQSHTQDKLENTDGAMEEKLRLMRKDTTKSVAWLVWCRRHYLTLPSGDTIDSSSFSSLIRCSCASNRFDAICFSAKNPITFTSFSHNNKEAKTSHLDVHIRTCSLKHTEFFGIVVTLCRVLLVPDFNIVHCSSLLSVEKANVWWVLRVIRDTDHKISDYAQCRDVRTQVEPTLSSVRTLPEFVRRGAPAPGFPNHEVGSPYSSTNYFVRQNTETFKNYFFMIADLLLKTLHLFAENDSDSLSPNRLPWTFSSYYWHPKNLKNNNYLAQQLV